jgi:dCTP deaminase
MDILDNIVQGYRGTLSVHKKPKFNNDAITEIEKQVHEILQDPDLSLKKATQNTVLKDFFKRYVLSEETVDEFGRDCSNSILIDDFDPAGLRPANYDLRLGKEVYVTADKLPRNLSETEDTVAIQPGEFGILTTLEYIHVPISYLGLISLRFSYKKQGLVNISGFHVDPGFTGRIVFSVFNTGPRSVVLRYKEPVFMIMFEGLSTPLKLKSGYSGGFSGQKHIPVDIITSLGGQSVSVIGLDKRLRRMETTLRILEALLVGLVIGVLGYLASTVLPHLHF